MEGTHNRCLLVPLPMLRLVFTEPDTAFDDMLEYGFYKSAMTEKIGIEEAASKLAYAICFPKGVNNELTSYLDSEIGSFVVNGDFQLGSDYKTDGERIASIVVHHALQDSVFNAAVLEWCKLRNAMSLFEVRGGSYQRTLDVVKRHGAFKNEPLCMLTKDAIFSARDEMYSEDAKIQFCMYAGIQSILGRKTWCYTHRATILERTFGCKDKATLQSITDSRILDAHKKWSARKRYERIYNRLENEGFISTFGAWRLVFVSISLTLDELLEAVKTWKIKMKTGKSPKERKVEKMMDEINGA